MRRRSEPKPDVHRLIQWHGGLVVVETTASSRSRYISYPALTRDGHAVIRTGRVNGHCAEWDAYPEELDPKLFGMVARLPWAGHDWIAALSQNMDAMTVLRLLADGSDDGPIYPEGSVNRRAKAPVADTAQLALI